MFVEWQGKNMCWGSSSTNAKLPILPSRKFIPMPWFKTQEGHLWWESLQKQMYFFFSFWIAGRLSWLFGKKIASIYTCRNTQILKNWSLHGSEYTQCSATLNKYLNLTFPWDPGSLLRPSVHLLPSQGIVWVMKSWIMGGMEKPHRF